MKRKKLRLSNKNAGAGFTLVELLVVVFIIVLLLSIAFGVLRLGIFTQRSAGQKQVLLDQVSLVAEYTSRSLRYAKKGGGVCTAPSNHYKITGTAPEEGIKFVNAVGECVHIYLDGADGIIKEDKAGNLRALTSDDLEVTAFRFEVTGTANGDDEQPRVTFTISAKPFQGTEDITIQNSISQRPLDN